MSPRMPRQGPAPRRERIPDPIDRSVRVTQIVNKVLVRGKRSTAERIVYTALETIEEKTGAEPIATLKRAIENIKPQLEFRSEEHTSELQSLMRISYAVFCLKKKKDNTHNSNEKNK